MELIETDKWIHYVIELGKSGLDTNHLDTMSLDDRLHLLDRYQDGSSWDTATVDQCGSLNPIDYIQRAKYYCQWNWICYKIDEGEGSKIVVSQLPSKLRGITERIVVSHKLAFEVEAFDIDPSRNLLVLAESRYVLLRLWSL